VFASSAYDRLVSVSDHVGDLGDQDSEQIAGLGSNLGRAVQHAQDGIAAGLGVPLVHTCGRDNHGHGSFEICEIAKIHAFDDPLADGSPILIATPASGGMFGHESQERLRQACVLTPFIYVLLPSHIDPEWPPFLSKAPDLFV
jgi:hypothetical protein